MSNFPPPSQPATPQQPTQFDPAPPKFSEYKSNDSSKKGLLIGLGITLSVVLILGITGFLVYRYYTQAQFRPTTLSEKEQVILDTKLEKIESGGEEQPLGSPSSRELNEVVINSGQQPDLTPAQIAELERLEEQERRTITLSEKEINAMMNYNTGLGERVKVRFKSGRIDVGWIISVDEEAPFVGGKTLRGSVDLSMEKLTDGRLAFAVEDVTVMGIPMPNAWLGDIKGQNLADRIGQDNEFFRIFSAGIEHIEISNGEVRVRLAH